MICFPNAKINLGLYITGKRANGYHNLASVFYPIPFCDILEIVPSDKFSFTSSGLPIPGNPESNLVVQAYKQIAYAFDIPTVAIHLHKQIPMGAGMGGGSADATFTLRTLNDLFELSLTDTQLKKLAITLGADCPFFLKNQPAYVTGIGEIFEPLPYFLKGKFIAIETPAIHVNTKEAFSNISIKELPFDLKDMVQKEPMTQWKKRLSNAFEKTIFPIYPKLEALKDNFYAQGAAYASMTGSGAAVYGLFDKAPQVNTKVISL